MRALDPGDCDTASALIRRAFTGLAVEPAPSALRVTADAVSAHLAAGGGGLIVDPAIACLLWSVAGDALQVSRLAVDPGHRRQGRAAALLAAADQEAIRLGLAVIRLSTRLAFCDNRRLFARCGFWETARHAHPGYETPTFVDLEKRLDLEKLLANPGALQASVQP